MKDLFNKSFVETKLPFVNFQCTFHPYLLNILFDKTVFQVFFLSFKLELWEPACRWDQVCVPDPDIGGLTGKPEAVGGGQHSVLVDQSPATNNLKFVQLCKKMYTVILYIFILGFSRMKWSWLLQGWSRVFLKWPTKSRGQAIVSKCIISGIRHQIQDLPRVLYLECATKSRADQGYYTWNVLPYPGLAKGLYLEVPSSGLAKSIY